MQSWRDLDKALNLRHHDIDLLCAQAIIFVAFSVSTVRPL